MIFCKQKKKNMVISGTLYDNEKMPLIGGHIQIMTSPESPYIPYTGTITNNKGKFIFDSNIINSNTWVKITFLGFKPIVIQANKLKNANLYMQIFEEELPEVIVTAPNTIKKPKTSYAGAWWILLLAGGYIWNKYANKSKKVKL